MSSTQLEVATRGRGIVDITAQVQQAIAAAGLREGLATVFVPGATASVTTLEFESGAVQRAPACPRDSASKADSR